MSCKQCNRRPRPCTQQAAKASCGSVNSEDDAEADPKEDGSRTTDGDVTNAALLAALESLCGKAEHCGGPAAATAAVDKAAVAAEGVPFASGEAAKAAAWTATKGPCTATRTMQWQHAWHACTRRP